jgi:glutamate-1-semialdehyde 2,1-aminomutase
MSNQVLANRDIEAAYLEKTPGSAALAEEARTLFPSGITHDGRYLKPYGIYCERAAGAHKWDVDGNRYVDYFGGHGALLLGHNHPQVLAATQAALAAGPHFGANHPLEIQWAQAIQRLVPSAERVRFTSSGTEATHLAVRLARAFTGRRKLLRFRTHFHGWHDHMTSGWTNHMDGSPTRGVLSGVSENVVLVDPNDVDGVRAALETDRDVAAVILEPTGSSFGGVPIHPSFLTALRELTAAHGALLIFDEVVTGFRVAPGGAQGHYGITPDLTSLAKIVAGGMPGGAIVGRAEILEALDFERSSARGAEKIQHPGTYNANPVSAAAGVATLGIIADGAPCERANASADYLRRAFNEVLAELGIAWAAYGTFSGVHIFTNAKGRQIDPTAFDPYALPFDELKTRQGNVVHRLRVAMLVNGIDFNGWPGCIVSAALSEQDLRETVDAFRDSLVMLQREGDIG